MILSNLFRFNFPANFRKEDIHHNPQDFYILLISFFLAETAMCQKGQFFLDFFCCDNSQLNIISN